MAGTRLDKTISYALLPAAIPAASYLLLAALPVAYAVALAAFVVTPVVCGAMLGMRHGELRVGDFCRLAGIYALTAVLVSELAGALVPLVASNLVNLPVYVVAAALLYFVPAVIVRSVRSRSQPTKPSLT